MTKRRAIATLACFILKEGTSAPFNAAFQTGWSSVRPRKPVASRVRTWNEQVDSSPEDSTLEPESMADLYRTVAREDSEWFQTFVTSVLGEDVVAEYVDLKSVVLSTQHETRKVTSNFTDAKKTQNHKDSSKVAEDISPVLSGLGDQNQISIEKFNVANGTSEVLTRSIDAGGQDVTLTRQDELEEDNFEKGVSDFPVARDEAEVEFEKTVDGSGILSVPLTVTAESPVNASTSEDLNVSEVQAETPSIPMASNSSSATFCDESVSSVQPSREQEISASTLMSRNKTLENVTSDRSKVAGVDSSDRVVLYRDMYTRDLQFVPLETVEKLGYNQAEIELLQPDALDVVVEDKIRRPMTGIPKRWQIATKGVVDDLSSNLDRNVRIVSRFEAERLIDENQTEQRQLREKQPPGRSSASKVGSKRATAKVQDPDADRPTVLTSGNGNDSVNSSVDEILQEPTVSPKGSTVPRRVQQVYDDKQAKSPRPSSRPDFEWSNAARKTNVQPGPETMKTRRREGGPRPTRNRYNPDGTTKPIFSGRPPVSESTRKRRQEDPPPPQSPFWMDIDTFRDLLRKEAELRVGILGSGWADIVKEESEWRLGLYKDWLWTLHRGLGEPIVPSRSQRRDIRQGDAPPPPERYRRRSSRRNPDDEQLWRRKRSRQKKDDPRFR